MSNEFKQEVILPSKGLLNPEISDGKVVQRCMMVTDQKALSGTNQSASSALNQLIQRTIVSPEDFNVDDLTMPDTIYLLFKLRVLSYGKDYTFRTRCPECGKKIDVTIDLSELPVTTLEEDYEKDLTVTLPHRGDIVHTKFLTNRDLADIDKEIKRRKKRNPNDDSAYILRLVNAIEKIELVKEKTELTHPLDIERYVETLTDLDATVIMSTRDAVDFGMAPAVEYVCPECNSDIDVSVQFSGEFFRPHISR